MTFFGFSVSPFLLSQSRVNSKRHVPSSRDYNYFVRHVGHLFYARAPTFPLLLTLERIIDFGKNIYRINFNYYIELITITQYNYSITSQ